MRGDRKETQKFESKLVNNHPEILKVRRVATGKR
jgi:hypothetical protein